MGIPPFIIGPVYHLDRWAIFWFAGSAIRFQALTSSGTTNAGIQTLAFIAGFRFTTFSAAERSGPPG